MFHMAKNMKHLNNVQIKPFFRISVFNSLLDGLETLTTFRINEFKYKQLQKNSVMNNEKIVRREMILTSLRRLARLFSDMVDRCPAPLFF